MAKLVFVDCEATGPCPGIGVLTEFGAVDYETRRTFRGVLHDSEPDPGNPVLSVLTGRAYAAAVVFGGLKAWLDGLGEGRPVFISDNPAFDFQWINHGFWHALGENPFGQSARRIGDYYAGLVGDFRRAQDWKRFRVTPHDHNPVDDAIGNVEAFETFQRLHREDACAKRRRQAGRTRARWSAAPPCSGQGRPGSRGHRTHRSSAIAR